MNPDTTQPPVDLITHPDGTMHYGSLFKDDPRNHNLAAYTPIMAASPISFYPTLEGIPHWNQHKLGACIGHAAGKAEQVIKFHEGGAVPEAIVPFSARFLYAMAKCLDGIPDQQGTYPATVASVMKKYGVATEHTCLNDTLLDHPTYTYGGVLANVPHEAITEAANTKIDHYAFVDINEAAIKTAIQFAAEHQGGVFMLSEIDKNWWTDIHGNISWTADDILPLRVPNDSATLGGHETMPYAFDEINGRSVLLDFNSWSDQWGDKGNAWLYLDEWLPHIKQIIAVFDLPENYIADSFRYTFKSSLKFGMTNSDVVALQHCLKIDGEFPPNTRFTGYFGNTTLAAVKAFQAKYAADILIPAGLTQPTGIVGTNTLKKLNTLFGV